jgi:hypothetical protein
MAKEWEKENIGYYSYLGMSCNVYHILMAIEYQ